MNATRMIQLMADLSAELASATESKDAFALHVFASRKQASFLCAKQTKHRGGREIESHSLSSYIKAREQFGYSGTEDEWRKVLSAGS
jgi:hypothetical protein